MGSVASLLRSVNAFLASTKSIASDKERFHNHTPLRTCHRFGFVTSTVTGNICAVVHSSDVGGNGGLENRERNLEGCSPKIEVGKRASFAGLRLKVMASGISSCESSCPLHI